MRKVILENKKSFSVSRNRKDFVISTKKQGIHLVQQGILGNSLRIWNSYNEIIKEKYGGTVTVRHRSFFGGSFCKYEFPVSGIPDLQRQLVKKGIKIEDLFFNESAPDSRILMQGETMRNPFGIYLHYSFEKKKMREALTNGKHEYGLNAKMLLQRFLCPSSYGDLQTLLELYPDHAIEFGAYEINLGNIPNRNTLIWEVRMY